MIWLICYSSMNFIDEINEEFVIKLIKDAIEIFNKFISELNKNVFLNQDNLIDQEIYIAKENINLLLMSYSYLNNEEKFFNAPKISNSKNEAIEKKNAKIEQSKHKGLKKLKLNQDNNINKNLKEKINFKNNTDNKKDFKNFNNSLIGLNLNLEFLSNITVIDNEMINYKDYQRFIIFSKLIENILKKDKNKHELIYHHLSYDEFDKNITNGEFNYFKEKYFGIKIMNNDSEIDLLDPSYTKRITLKDEKLEQTIFINKPYEYFKISDVPSGVIKSRRKLCKKMKFNFIEYDFHEFLNYSNMLEEDFNLTKDNLKELIERVEEYLEIKNEVFANKN